MFVSISVGAAADAETDVDAAGGAEFCDAAAAPCPAGVTLAGIVDAPGAEPEPAAFVPATVEDAIRLFVGGTVVVVLAPEIVCCGGQEVLVLLLALELPLMPEEG